VEFTAIAENDSLAESVGIDTMRHKILAFTIGCFFAGIIGSVYASYYIYISPDNFSLWQSIYILLYVVVGGVATPSGAVLGAIALTGLSELVRSAQQYEPVIFGAILLAVVFVMPSGILGLTKVFQAWMSATLKKRRGSDAISRD
jgi:branched-chain amino acid transport system permease protein